jgi:hypothetical protein
VLRLKVEVLIPKCYNDKTPIEGWKYRVTYRDVFKQFNGCTVDKSPLIGEWLDPKTGKKYKDRNIAYWVICDDTYDSMNFLDKLKETLKTRFQQEEIMMYSTNIHLF